MPIACMHGLYYLSDQACLLFILKFLNPHIGYGDHAFEINDNSHKSSDT